MGKLAQVATGGQTPQKMSAVANATADDKSPSNIAASSQRIDNVESKNQEKNWPGYQKQKGASKMGGQSGTWWPENSLVTPGEIMPARNNSMMPTIDSIT